jgi:predicted nuclease of predicted toxin-antitoxin system
MRQFLVDANLPIALARQLAIGNVDCVHVVDLADLATPDMTLWDLANVQHRTIITRDADFADLVRVKPAGPAVVWVRLGNVRKRVLVQRIQRDWPKILALLDAGERLIELRS